MSNPTAGPERIAAIRKLLADYERDDHFNHGDIAAELAEHVPFLLDALAAAQGAGMAQRQGNYYGQSLTVTVEDGRLVIAIGVQTLAHAVTYSDWANPWRDDPAAEAGGDYRRDFVILDAEQFAKDVAHAMLAEREDGSTPLSDFIDKSSLAAVEDGSIATDDAPKGGVPHGKTDPRETWAEAPHA